MPVDMVRITNILQRCGRNIMRDVTIGPAIILKNVNLRKSRKRPHSGNFKLARRGMYSFTFTPVFESDTRGAARQAPLLYAGMNALVLAH